MKNKINTSTGVTVSESNRSVVKTTAQIVLAATLLFVACKKKEETNNTTNTNTTTGSTTGTPTVVRTMTSTVNNLSWQANSDGYQKSSTNIQFTFGGATNTSSPNTLISFGFPKTISAGTYSLSQMSAVQAYYKDSSNVFYTANVGSINITQIDTASPANGIITKFKATFSFTTGVVSSKSFTVNNGYIDYNK